MSLNLKNNPLKSQDFSKNAITFARRYAYLKEDTARCTRCGACLQGCTSYKTLNMENFSPRGRVQLLQFLLERKIDLKENEEMLLKCINSCAQCGQCSEFCAVDLRIDNFIFDLKSFFAKATFRTKYFNFYHKYPSFLFFFFTFFKNIKQAKKEETKTLLLTSKEGLKFASSSLASLSDARVSKQSVYINEVLYQGDKDMLAFILKNLKKEINSLGKVRLVTDNIIIWRFLKKFHNFKKIELLSPTDKSLLQKNNFYVINNNSFKEKEENLFPCCLKSNFFVEFTQNLLHTPANRFWRSLSLEEEKLFASSLKKYEGKTLLALCAEDKVFYDRLKRKYKVKLDIFSLAQIINGNGKTK
jgi:Fe-S oxidoreductase